MQTLDHAESISAAFFMRGFNFVHDAPNKMRAQPARAYFIKIARPNPIELERRAAIPEHDLEEILAVLAGDFNTLAVIALIGVPDNVAAGFVHGKDYFSLPGRRETCQLTRQAHHAADDGKELGIRGNFYFDHFG
jgi:hypothetical protein